jgi:hypothetical protein
LLVVSHICFRTIPQVKRMCWSIVLLSMVEAIDEIVESAVKREEKQAEKMKELGSFTISNVGVLATNSSRDFTCSDITFRKNREFIAIWYETNDWNEKLIADAVSFAKANTPRLTTDFEQNKSERSHTSMCNDTETMFKSNVWPSLKLRGWTSTVGANEINKYCFNGNEVCVKRFTIHNLQVPPHFSHVHHLVLLH